MKFISPYFNSEWSFAQYKVLEGKTKVAFGKEDKSLYIIGYDGTFYSVFYDDVNGGECLKAYTAKMFSETTPQ